MIEKIIELSAKNRFMVLLFVAMISAWGLWAVLNTPLEMASTEFMPPLNEGSILYMPTSIPGMPPAEAKKILHTQDKILKTFPEVERVLVPIPHGRDGAQVPIGQLAEIVPTTGAPMIRSEAGSKVGFVFVDVEDKDYGRYVERAQQYILELVFCPSCGVPAPVQT